MKNCIVTILDDKYLSGFLLTLHSIIKSTQNIDFDIIVLEWGELSDDSKSIIGKIYDKIIYKKVDIDLYKKCYYDEQWRVWTYNCNYRFDIFTLVEYDKVMFFDCDILFNIDVKEILSHDVDFGACPAYPRTVNQTNKINNFGGGLLLVGKKFLNNDTRQGLIDVSLSKPIEDRALKGDKWISDEPILNVYFQNYVKFLPENYNLEIVKLTTERLKEKNNFHFVGHNKPWYGKRLNDRFDTFVFNTILTKTDNPSNIHVIKELLNIFNTTVKEIKETYNIDIYEYAYRIEPKSSKIFTGTESKDVTKFSCWPIVKKNK